MEKKNCCSKAREKREKRRAKILGAIDRRGKKRQAQLKRNQKKTI